jgi:hypothetical protein
MDINNDEELETQGNIRGEKIKLKFKIKINLI